MPDDAQKLNILAYRTRMASLGLLSKKRSDIVVEAALRWTMHDARVRSAELDQYIERKRRAVRDIWIVAITGCVSCIGAYAATATFARAGGYAYTTGSWAAPMVTTMHGLVRVVSPAGLTLKQWLTAKMVETAVLTIPTGMALRSGLGANALDLLTAWWLGLITETMAVTPEQLRRLRDELVADGIGDAAFQRTMRDPNARHDRVVEAMRVMLRERVANDVIEVLAFMDPPANLLLIMTDLQFNNWRRQFEAAAEAQIAQNHPDISVDERRLLFNRVVSEIWHDIHNQLNAYERAWHGQIAEYKRAINREIFSFNVLLSPR